MMSIGRLMDQPPCIRASTRVKFRAGRIALRDEELHLAHIAKAEIRAVIVSARQDR